MTTTGIASKRCSDCGADVAGGLLACPGCGRLVHRDELSRLAATATTAEREGDLTAALGAWRGALELLPRNSDQYGTITRRMQQLSAAVDGRGKAPEGVGTAAKGGKAGKAAAAGAVGVALLKSKALLGVLLGNAKLLLAGLLKLPTLLSMLVFARWSAGSGLGFGLGLVASIYVHEVGHVAALRRYGIAASAPMFIPGLGAFVRMDQYPTDAHEEARTGLAGPLWGLSVAVVVAIFAKVASSSVATSVASAGATLNLFNLIPVWVLDGSRGLRALNRAQRLAVAGTGVLTAVVVHQWTPLIVGGVAFSRAFASDAHPTGDRRMCALFVTLIVVLALVATLPVVLPGR